MLAGISVDLAVNIITIAIGLFLCFFGYKTFRVALALLFAVLGSNLGIKVFDLVSTKFQCSNPDLTRTILVASFTLVAAVLSYALYTKSVVLLTCLAGCFLFYKGYVSFLMDPSEMSKVQALLIGLCFGIVLAILVHFVQKFGIKLFTSLMGAKLLAGMASGYLLGFKGFTKVCDKIVSSISIDSSLWRTEVVIELLFMVVLFLLGFVKQLKKR